MSVFVHDKAVRVYASVFLNLLGESGVSLHSFVVDFGLFFRENEFILVRFFDSYLVSDLEKFEVLAVLLPFSNSLFVKMLSLLAVEKKFYLVSCLLEIIDDFLSVGTRRVRVRVESAVKLSESDMSMIRDSALISGYGPSELLCLSNVLNGELIGGIRFVSKFEVLDFSVAGYVFEMKKVLMSCLADSVF